MADLQMVLAEAVKLNQSITQFINFTTYPKCGDLSGLDMDLTDLEQIMLWDELWNITDKLADVQARINYLSQPVVEVSRLSKGTAGKYRTEKEHYYDCQSSIEALVTDEYRDAPYWTRTTVEHDGKDYYLRGFHGLPMDGLTVRVRATP